MPLFRTALLAGLATLAVAAPALAAPTLTALKPCYVSVMTAKEAFDTEPVTVGGAGFTPNSLVDIAVDGSVVAAGVQVDEAGNLPEGTVKAPVVESGQRPFTVTATEQQNAAQTASAGSLVSDLSVKLKPRRARPSRRIRFRGRGFTAPGVPVYAHYVRGGKVRRTVRLVKAPAGPCGTFSVRRKQFPFTPRTGRWTVQFDQHKAYTAEPPLVSVAIDVKRVPRTKPR